MEFKATLSLEYRGDRTVIYTLEQNERVQSSDPSELMRKVIDLVYGPSQFSSSLKDHKDLVAPVVDGFNTLLERINNKTTKLHLLEVPRISDLWTHTDPGFTLAAPMPPALQDLPAEPDISNPRYNLPSSFSSFIFSAFDKRWLRDQLDHDSFQADMEQWVQTKANVEQSNSEALAEYRSALEEWTAQKDAHRRTHESLAKTLRKRLENLNAGDADEIKNAILLLLSQDPFPFDFKRNVRVHYDTENKIVLVEYNLPRRSDIPHVKSIKYVVSQNRIDQRDLTGREFDDAFDGAVYSLILYCINCVFTNLHADHISAVVFNGYVEDVDRATGKQTRGCIVSLQCDRMSFADTFLKDVDPKAWFRHLKGVGSSKLHSITPVSPIMDISRADRRFVEGYGVTQTLSEGTNLAAMDWYDFENLIRQLFEQEFSANGGEVKITQSSRDGGVDAVAFDPDPIRGGKIVIQAKRYTNTVGVAAVRDLYGTLINEGATKGILVTTSNYGPDAYEFAKGKPITLLNGGHLLGLLQKHGYKAIINLPEAKRLLAEKYQMDNGG